jgi:hypothetical protein
MHLCLIDLANLTGGQLQLAAMPPLDGVLARFGASCYHPIESLKMTFSGSLSIALATSKRPFSAGLSELSSPADPSSLGPAAFACKSMIRLPPCADFWSRASRRRNYFRATPRN